MLTSRKQFLQQTGFALAGSLFPISKIFASSNTERQFIVGDSFDPKNCDFDMTVNYQYNFSNNASSQIAVEEGFYSSPNPPDNKTNPLPIDVMYALEGQAPDDDTCDPFYNACRTTDWDPRNPNALEGRNPFRYIVYYPKPEVHNYQIVKLPCIVFFHAGGFQECPDLTLPIIKKLCIELSRKGFICFTVEYRRGRIKDPISGKTSVQQQLASYRAIQDGCGAIRSIIKKNRTSGEFSFIIDEDAFFIGGTSAGGIIANACAYYRTDVDLINSQTQIDAVYQKLTGTTYSIKEVLGNMHANNYYAPPDKQYWPIIKGVACMWSGIQIPLAYDGGTDKGITEKGFFPNSTTWANPQ